MDGNAFIKKLRRSNFTSYQKWPALALTAYTAAEDRRRCLESGFSEYLTKPASQHQLVSMVSKLFAKRLIGRVESEGLH